MKRLLLLFLCFIIISCQTQSASNIVESKITGKFIELERYVSPDRSFTAVLGQSGDSFIKDIPMLRILKNNIIIFETEALYVNSWMEGIRKKTGWSSDGKYFFIYYLGEKNQHYFNVYYADKNILIRNYLIDYDLIKGLMEEVKDNP